MRSGSGLMRGRLGGGLESGCCCCCCWGSVVVGLFSCDFIVVSDMYASALASFYFGLMSICDLGRVVVMRKLWRRAQLSIIVSSAFSVDAAEVWQSGGGYGMGNDRYDLIYCTCCMVVRRRDLNVGGAFDVFSYIFMRETAAVKSMDIGEKPQILAYRMSATRKSYMPLFIAHPSTHTSGTPTSVLYTPLIQVRLQQRRATTKVLRRQPQRANRPHGSRPHAHRLPHDDAFAHALDAIRLAAHRRFE